MQLCVIVLKDYGGCTVTQYAETAEQTRSLGGGGMLGGVGGDGGGVAIFLNPQPTTLSP